MYSNPTYANPDGSSAQIHQFDTPLDLRRQGARRTWELSPTASTSPLGTENRYDDIGRGRRRTTPTAASSWTRSAPIAVKEASASLYRRGDLAADRRACASPAACAATTITCDVEAHERRGRRRSARARSDAMLSPKVSAAYKVTDHVELYANWGRGFHSNDVRGVVNDATPVPVLVRGHGQGDRRPVPARPLHPHRHLLVAGRRQRAEVRRRLERGRAHRRQQASRL